MKNQILEKKANDFRLSNGIDGEDYIRFRSFLSKLNIITLYTPLGSGFSGMALKIGVKDDSKRFILVNSSHPRGKQHFTICHELYHLFVQDDFSSMICNAGSFDKKDINEYNADVFASHFLLPHSGIMSLIPDEELEKKNTIKLSTILKIEQYYTCSRTALLYRLKEMKIIDDAGYERYSSNVKRSALEYGYSTDLYEEGNHGLVIGDYGTLAKELFDSDKISESHYYSMMMDLGIDLERVEKLKNGDSNGENG